MKEKVKKIVKRISIIMIILIFDVLTVVTTCQTFPDIEVPLNYRGSCGELLKYKGEIVDTNYVYYTTKIHYLPTYCLDITKQGVDGQTIYGIKEKDYIKDEKLWRYIINGFPYKTIEELGCQTIEEAYMATQQAIYCYLYGYDLKDFEAIGEAGERTLNALKKIVQNAKVSTEKRPENVITIEETQEEFEVDSIDDNYISKTYQVTSESYVLGYVAFFANNEKNICKITDENNVPKAEFKENEKFKVLIPKEYINQEIKFELYVNATIYSKAIIEGVPDDPLYQKYAMTATAEEVVSQSKEDEYPKPKEEIKETPKEEQKEEVNETPKEEQKEEVNEHQKEKTEEQTKKLPVTGM